MTSMYLQMELCSLYPAVTVVAELSTPQQVHWLQTYGTIPPVAVFSKLPGLMMVQ